jgi:hypothetical protein
MTTGLVFMGQTSSTVMYWLAPQLHIWEVPLFKRSAGLASMVFLDWDSRQPVHYQYQQDGISHKALVRVEVLGGE